MKAKLLKIAENINGSAKEIEKILAEPKETKYIEPASPKYLKALEGAREKWLRGKNARGKYKEWWDDEGRKPCDMCKWHRQILFDSDTQCKPCFLNDKLGGNKLCAVSLHVCKSAYKANDFTAFHQAALDMLNRIEAEIERVKAEMKSKPLYEVGKEYLWSGIAARVGKKSEPRKVKIVNSNDKFQLTSEHRIDYPGAEHQWWVSESEPSPIPQSEHVAGERFDDKWNYAGVMQVPDPKKDTWVSDIGLLCVANDGVSSPCLTVNHGFREILVARNDRVGEIIKAGEENTCTEFFEKIPYRAFKIVRWDDHANKDEIFINDSSKLDYSGYVNGYKFVSGYRWVLKPLLEKHTVHAWKENGEPYEFEIEGDPDPDRIYKETIGEGALVSWVRMADGSYRVFRSEGYLKHYPYFHERETVSEHGWQRQEWRSVLAEAVKEYVAARQKEKPRVAFSCPERECEYYAGASWKLECSTCRDKSNFKAKEKDTLVYALLCSDCESQPVPLGESPCKGCFGTINKPNFKPKVTWMGVDLGKVESWTVSMIYNPARNQGKASTKKSKEKDAWTRTIGWLRVRAYRDKWGTIKVLWSCGEVWSFTRKAEEVLATMDIPIKPYKDGEKMEAPE
jgi:hypothetical protein